MSITAYTRSGKRAYRAKIKFLNRQYTKAGFPTKESAKEWMIAERKKLKIEASQPEDPQDQSVLMFSAASEMYLEDCQARFKGENTVAEKYRHLTEYGEFLGGDAPVSSLNTNDARKFISAIQRRIIDDEGAPLKSKDGSSKLDNNKCANRYLRTLKAFWNWLAKRQAIGQNPFFPIEPYPEDTAPQYIPPPEDVIAVLRVAQQWERDFLNVLVRTAARPGEVRTLTWDDINFSRGTITLWTRKRKGGKRQPRMINMTDQLSDILKRRFQSRLSEVFVFVNEQTGKPFTRQSRPYKYLMERLCEKASEQEDRKIILFSYKSFRHFVATRLRDSGKASRYEIQHLLGHQRSDTTDIYLRSLAPDIKEAVSVMDEVIGVEKIESHDEDMKIIKMARA